MNKVKNQDHLFLWKAQLLDKIFRFAVIFGFVTLLVSGTITLLSGLYLQTTLYVLVYMIALYTAYKKGLSFQFKVNSLIIMTYILALIVLILEGDITIGLVWVIYSVFFAVTFLQRSQYIKIIVFSVVVISLWYCNYIYMWIEPVRHLKDIPYYIKYTNSIIFLIAGILYINEHLIQNIAKSLFSERNARNELKQEKRNIEGTNEILENKLIEIDGLKSELEKANLLLSDRVEEQEIGIKETLADLRKEIVNHKITELELIKTREELILSLDKEKALNEMKSKFISMISHEYRTPLTVLMNSTYLLDKYFEINEREKFNESIKKINHSVMSMTELLEEVIRFGHSDIAEQDNELVEMDIVHQVNTVVANFKNQEEKEFDIIINSSENPLLINTDARKVRLIINNLIKNAILYTNRTPEISVSIEKVNQEVIVKLKDNGIGITDNDINMIFEPFYRGENTIGKSGTGLGLSISQRYAISLGGNINVESQRGKGSNFTLTLPINKL